MCAACKPNSSARARASTKAAACPSSPANPVTKAASATSSRARRCRGRCRADKTRRNVARMGFTRNSCREPRLPPRVPPIGEPGCTAFGRRSCTGPSGRCATMCSPICRRRRPWRPISCAGIRCRCPPRRPISSMGSCRLRETARLKRHSGCGIYLYAANRPMRNRCFYSADGEWLIVPQFGAITLDTELGRIGLEPQEIAVIPRGLRFRVDLPARPVAAMSARISARRLKLPDLGPIGSNGLANPRDFRAPEARYEDRGRPRADREVSRPAVDGADGSFAARCGRLARQRRCPTNTICGTSMRSARSPTTTRIRRYFWCCIRPSDTPGTSNSTSSSFRRAGSSWRTPSGRRGSTAMSRANTWD